MTAVGSPHGSDVSAAEWIYRMEVAHALPLLNLDRTPISSLLSVANHVKFLAVMRHHYASFGSLFRFSGVCMLVVLVAPRTIGCWLSVPTMLMAFPSLTCGPLMNSSDILRILPRQYEFWFFTALNLINWSCLASFYSDIRIVSLFGGIVGTQLVILIDSNFRTVTSSIRSTSVAAPVLLVLGIAAFFRVIDTQEQNYRVIPVAKINVTLLDVFVNTSMTLGIFVARKGYAKRKVLITHSAALRTIRCVVIRSKFQLKKPSLRRGESCTLLTETRTFVMERPTRGASPCLTRTVSSFSVPTMVTRQPTATNVSPFDAIDETPATPDPIDNDDDGTADAAAPTPVTAESGDDHQQRVTLVSLQLGAVDIRDIVAPRFAPLYTPLSPLKSFLFHANAVVGFTTTIFTLSRHPAGTDYPPTTLEYALAVTSLACTLIFFFTCVASFHRALALQLLHNFDFLFSSVQFTMAIALISDMLLWDFRTLGTLAWLVWFHSVLFLDALTPPLKRNLQFRKVYLLPVVAASLVGIGFIIYGFFFSNLADYFVERTLWETRFRNKTIGFRTKSLLLNRLFTVLLWSFRLIWEVAVCPDDELIFIRGNLDYFTPMEMIPPLRSTSSAVIPKVMQKSRRMGFVRKWFSRRRAVHATDATHK